MFARIRAHTNAKVRQSCALGHILLLASWTVPGSKFRNHETCVNLTKENGLKEVVILCDTYHMDRPNISNLTDLSNDNTNES